MRFVQLRVLSTMQSAYRLTSRVLPSLAYCNRRNYALIIEPKHLNAQEAAKIDESALIAMDSATLASRHASLSKAEMDILLKHYNALEAKDWKTLSNEDKKKIYLIAFGPEAKAESGENMKVFLGTVAVVGAAVAVYTFIRSQSLNPTSFNDEKFPSVMQQTKDKLMKEGRLDPVFGKKD